MSDPIIGILEGFESESKFTGNEAYDDLLSESVKQIRQQIGREINKVAVRRGHFLAVREVCQLEEE